MDEDRGKVPPLVEVIRISFGDWLSLGVEVLILVGYSWLCVGTGARVAVDPQAIRGDRTTNGRKSELS